MGELKQFPDDRTWRVRLLNRGGEEVIKKATKTLSRIEAMDKYQLIPIEAATQVTILFMVAGLVLGFVLGYAACSF